jgi:hypothetical protein
MWRIPALLFWHMIYPKIAVSKERTNVLGMNLLAFSTAFAFLLMTTALNAQKERVQTLVIERPTILAFFPPLSEADLDKDPDTNEALGDFQLYASRVGPPLKAAGIDFEVVSAVRFKVRNGAIVRAFRTGKIGIGYYFVAPGKEPHVEFGVMTDDAILEVASKYFKIALKN